MPALISALEPVARIAVATLFNSLWEAALLALAVALILRVFSNLNATTRYALWSIALVGSLLLPLATSLPQVSVEKAFAPVQTAQHTVVQNAPVQTALVHRSTGKHVQQSAVLPPPTTQNARPAFRLPDRLRFSLPEYVALGLFVVWAIATLALLVRLGVNLWRLERLKTDALPLPVDYRDRLSRWSKAEKGGRDVRLCTCDRIEVPVAVGLFDSMILIPQHLLETLSQEEMDQVMLHELAHLRRADDWTNGVQRVIQALFFFNPAVLYIAHQLDVEREVACDDWVVHETREVRPYATCLTKMAEVTAWPHRPLAAPGVFVTRRGLSVRVERLLRAGRNVRTSVAFGPAGAAVAALVVLFFVLQTVAPSFAFTLPQEQVAVASVVRAAKPVAHPAAKSVAKPVTKIVYVTHSDAKTMTSDAKTMTSDANTAVSNAKKASSDANRAGSGAFAVQAAPPAPHVHVHVAMAPKVPSIASNPVLPPDFAKNVQAITAKSIHQAMKSVAFDGSHGENANCVGCDYSGQNLSGHNFRNQRMNGADFSKANLQNADFSGAVLVGADFSGANLRGASFSHAVLTGCDLSHADVTDVNFDGATVTGCDVSAKALSPHQASALIHACRSGCDFTGVNLQNQDLRGLSITGVDLTHADLRGANLSGVNFSGVDLSGARVDGANVDGARFTGCDFSGVDLHNVDMSKAMVVGTRFGR